MAKVDRLLENLEAGRVYRRAELQRWSNAVDRHLAELVEKGTLQKLANGLYYCPKKSVFGDVPPEDDDVVRVFLKDERFLVTSLNAYNSLGVKTTQLYKDTIVYNRKRHGRFTFGGREFEFRKRPNFPQELSAEFLLVDLVNNLDSLAEDTVSVLDSVKERVKHFDLVSFTKAVKEYGASKTRCFFADVLNDDSVRYAA